MVMGALTNPHVMNLTAFLIWGWSLIPTSWSNKLLQGYIFLKEVPDRFMSQLARSCKALLHSFQNDAYWFYSVGDHYFAQHDTSSVVKVHKGKPQWMYTPHNSLFSWVAPITHAENPERMRDLINAPVVYKQLPIIGAMLYSKTADAFFEYDMSEWISDVRIKSLETCPIDVVPLLVLILAWGLTHNVSFEGDLSTMVISMTMDTGDEKRFRVVTQEEIEEGEILEDYEEENNQENTQEDSQENNQENGQENDLDIDCDSSTDSDESLVLSSRPLQPTPVDRVEENT
jgi:hypothetical protein